MLTTARRVGAEAGRAGLADPSQRGQHVDVHDLARRAVVEFGERAVGGVDARVIDHSV